MLVYVINLRKTDFSILLQFNSFILILYYVNSLLQFVKTIKNFFNVLQSSKLDYHAVLGFLWLVLDIFLAKLLEF